MRLTRFARAIGPGRERRDHDADGLRRRRAGERAGRRGGPVRGQVRHARALGRRRDAGHHVHGPPRHAPERLGAGGQAARFGARHPREPRPDRPHPQRRGPLRGQRLVRAGHRPALRGGRHGPATAEQGAKVTLSAEGSEGTIYRSGALNGPETATPTFTVPTLNPVTSTRDLVFTLTIKGAGGTSTATVTVKVNPVAAPVAMIAPVGAVDQGSVVTLDGSGSTGAQTYKWEYVKAAGDPDITL